MESDDDFDLLPSSPVHERKLKRLKKATRPPEFSPSPPNFSELRDSETLYDSVRPEPEGLDLIPQLDAAMVDGLGAKRVLDFDSVSDELDGGKVAEENRESANLTTSEEVGDLETSEDVEDLKTSEDVEDLKTGEEVGDVKTDESERKQPNLDVSSEKKNKKKKKRMGGDDANEKMPKESITNKRRAEKERRETLKQLRAESQRLLRETRDVAFKPAPLVHKPISSILDKIRQRKLEILRKSRASFEDTDDLPVDEEMSDMVEKVESDETRAPCPASSKSDLNTPHISGSNDAADDSSCESVPSPTVMGSEPEHTFRAPIDDTQELFSDSQRSDDKIEEVNEKCNDPSEEIFAPSMPAMNLKLDSVLPDDDASSDEEDNDKENIDPHLSGSVDLSLPTSGDPVRAFVDEEAEEEDDSDNDLQRFQDNEEGEEEDDDIEELNDMIATEYEEKPIDREKRDQLHQQWLEKQDTDGMDNLLQKLNCRSKLEETSIEEEDEESRESENEFDDEAEAEEYVAPSEAMKINLKRVKQMIPLMYADKDDKYVSSDDDETEEKLARQHLYYKTEEKAKLFSPAEDENSREVFSLIKKINVVPDSKRKGRPTSISDMRIGQNISISSKSSFVGRASSHFMRTSQKLGSCKVRSYIFERDDSNSRTSASMPEDSSDAIQIQRESQPPKTVSAKFQKNTQNKYTTLNSTSHKSNVSLLEILGRSSHRAEHYIHNAEVQQNSSVFDAFKLVKNQIKS